MNDNETELLAAVFEAVTELDALNVDYLIGGSIASSLFGEPRQTLDADLIAQIEPPPKETNWGIGANESFFCFGRRHNSSQARVV